MGTTPPGARRPAASAHLRTAQRVSTQGISSTAREEARAYARRKAAAAAVKAVRAHSAATAAGGHAGRLLLVKVGVPVAVVCLAALLVMGLISSIAGVLGGYAAAAASTDDDCYADGAFAPPGPAAVADIPSNYLAAYQGAAATVPGMHWALLAAIGKIETNHGRSRLPGVSSGENSAGAGGPMQFLQATFDAYAVDGDGDGLASRYNIADAAYTAAAYLQANGAPTNLQNAIWHYNHAQWYVDQVLALFEGYLRDAAHATTTPAPLPSPSGLRPATPSPGAADVAELADGADCGLFGGILAAEIGPGGMTWPISIYPHRITSQFGWRIHPITGVRRLHAGVDFGAPIGATVHSVKAGTVRLVRDYGSAGYGKYVCVQHTASVSSCYAHLSRVDVHVGQTLLLGQQLGLSGNTGASTGPHLHFEIRVNGAPANPLPYLPVEILHDD